MKKFFSTVLVSLGAGAVFLPAQAAVVHVHFIEPDRFTDTRVNGEASRDALIAIERAIVALGEQCLPSNQNLEVEIRDIDLAGTSRYVSPRQSEVRIIRSGVDAPRITLHYTLTENGRVISSKEEVLRDLSFMEHRRLRDASQSYPYEKRLLADWFRERFGGTCRSAQQASHR